MNVNRPSRDRVRTEMMVTVDVAELHVKSLGTMLKEAGVSRQVQDTAQEFMQAIVERMKHTETLVLAFAREPDKLRIKDLLSEGMPAVNAFDVVLSRLEEFANGFVREAETPGQETQAAAFKRFVEGMSMAWEAPERGKNKNRDMDLEM